MQEDLQFLGNKDGTSGVNCPTTPVASRSITADFEGRIITIHVMPALAGDEDPVATILASIRVLD